MFDIALIGGGLVGFTFALDIAKKRPDFKVLIIEKNEYKIPSMDTFDSRIYAISPQNLEYLASINVIPDIERLGIIEKMDVYGDKGSELVLDSRQNREMYLSKTVEYKNLQSELFEQLNTLDNVSFIYGEVKDIVSDSDMVNITLNHQLITTRFLVGSDGGNSLVRQKFNIKADLFDYGYSGVVANFETELDHKNVAYQWFKDSTILALLPLTKNKVSIVWSTNEYEKLLTLKSEQFEHKVMEFSCNKLGKLKLISKPVAFPLRLYTIDKVYAHRVVLIGDAAHTIHPLAGQGVNLGFGDAKALANTLTDVSSSQLGDISILRKYNASRILKVKQMQITCHSLHLLFKSSNNIVRTFRNIGLNMVNNIPLVKKYLIKQAVSY